MSNDNKNIKAALKKILVPHLAAEEFPGKFPEFTRREGDTLHLLSVQFDKWGGGFFLGFAPYPPGDKTMSWAKLRFDVYAPRQARNAPIIFIVHGGAWRIGDKAAKSVIENKVARWVPWDSS